MKKCFVIILTISLSMVSAANFAQNKIVVGGSAGLKSTVYGVWSEMIYQEAFKRLGYEFEYVGFPAARVKYQFVNGKLDGEINRIASYNEGRPNLIRVEEAHFRMNSMAYFTDPNLILLDWESFTDIKKVVEYRNGSKLFNDKMTAHVAPEYRSTINSAKQGIKRLLLARTDIYLELEVTAQSIINTLDIKYDTTQLQPPVVLQVSNSYLFLHKRHHLLIEQVSAELKKMKKEGTIEALRLLALEKYEAKHPRKKV